MSHCFEAIEGQYRLCRSSISPCQNSTLNKVAVRLSYFDESIANKSLHNLPDGDVDSAFNNFDYHVDGLFCYNIGKEVYIHNSDNQNIPIDRRVFKARPTCHAFKYRYNPGKPCLAVGLGNGEIHLLCPRKDICKVFNDEKTIDETPVTCLAWVPDSPNQFIVSNLSGNLYLYDENISNSPNPPSYELFKEGVGFSVYTCKAKSTRNPLYRWAFGVDLRAPVDIRSQATGETWPRAQEQSRRFEFNPLRSNSVEQTFPACSMISNDRSTAINQFAFSPCGQYLAVVTQDGYLRVLDYHIMELYGFMRSYFAGLLCVDWSPDGRYIAVGGQDDLITVWSMAERSVICRGQGHRSWINTIRFDPYVCPSLQLPTNTLGSQTSDIPNGASEYIAVEPERAIDRRDFDATVNCDSEVMAVHSTPSSTSSNTALTNVIDGVPLGDTYRLGSVGQDTFFCLWDLTDDVIRHGIQFVREFSRLRLTSDYQRCSVNSDNDPGQANSATSPTGNNLPSTSFPRHPRAPGHGESRSMTSPSSLFNFLSLNRRKSVTGERNNRRGRRNRKRLTMEPSRGTSSTAWWNLANGSTDLADSSTPYSTLAQAGCSDGLYISDSLLGSPMCPRLGDVPMLQPIVCNMMHQHRLTDLVFRRGSISIICQQGIMQVWSRPPIVEQSRSVGQDSQPGSSHKGGELQLTHSQGRSSNGESSGLLSASCRTPRPSSSRSSNMPSPMASVRPPERPQGAEDPLRALHASDPASRCGKVSLQKTISTSWPPRSPGNRLQLLSPPSSTGWESSTAAPGVASSPSSGNSANACNHHGQQQESASGTSTGVLAASPERGLTRQGLANDPTGPSSLD